jgi:hypothetical protein
MMTNSVSNMGTLISPPQPIPIQTNSNQITLKPERYDFIRDDAKLSEGERKYCRCLMHVQEKGGGYNPYAVCTSRVGSQVHSCSPYYDWSIMGLNNLIAYADLHNITLTDRSSREAVLNAIGAWKQSRGESF